MRVPTPGALPPATGLQPCGLEGRVARVGVPPVDAARMCPIARQSNPASTGASSRQASNHRQDRSTPPIARGLPRPRRGYRQEPWGGGQRPRSTPTTTTRPRRGRTACVAQDHRTLAGSKLLARSDRGRCPRLLDRSPAGWKTWNVPHFFAPEGRKPVDHPRVALDRLRRSLLHPWLQPLAPPRPGPTADRSEASTTRGRTPLVVVAAGLWMGLGGVGFPQVLEGLGWSLGRNRSDRGASRCSGARSRLCTVNFVS